MKTTNKNTYCEYSDKYCYTSEAKAVRAIGRYEEVKRAYHCTECNSWHTTKMRTCLALDMGVLERKKRKQLRPVHTDTIENRLNQLKNRNK